MSKKQIGINMLANAVSFIVATGINFYFTPFLIRNVGMEAYSFMPLTSNITSYFLIVSTALNSMAARFTAIALHKGEHQKASSYFTSVLYGNIVLSFLFGIVFTFLVVFLDKLIKIPPSLVPEIKMLFALTFASAIIMLLCSVYSISTFCKNKLSWDSSLNIITAILRVLLLILLFFLFKPSIVYIGIVTFVISVVMFFKNITFKKKLLPEVRVKKEYFSFEAIKTLIGAGIWNCIAQSGSILLNGLDLLLANIYLSASAAGNISVAKTIPLLIYSLSPLVAKSFAPQFTIYYANEKKEQLLGSIRSAMKIVTLFLSIPIAGFIVFGKEFYSLWIPGQNIGLIYMLSILAIISPMFNVFITVLNQVFPLTNKLRLPTIYTASLGVLNVLLVLLSINLFPKYAIYFITGISGVLILTEVLIFKPIYAAKCLGLKKSTFYPQLLRSIISTAVLTLAFWGLSFIVVADSWLSLLLAAVLCGAVGLEFNFLFMLSKGEQKHIINLFKARLSKMKK